MSPSGLAMKEVEGGLPHSEILGSKLVRSSPRLIAAYHVLHRLSAPRHPPNTLKALDRSHEQCSPARATLAWFGPLKISQQEDLNQVRRSARLSGSPDRTLERIARKDQFASTMSGVRAVRQRRWFGHPVHRSEQNVRTWSLFTMSKISLVSAHGQIKKLGFLTRMSGSVRRSAGRRRRRSCVGLNGASPAQALVEPDGIEPTTSCLQSTRSPN